MKVSLNWLKQYVDFDGPPGELAQQLTMLGLEVEDVRTLAGDAGTLISDIDREHLRRLDEPDWIYTYGNEGVRPLLMRLAAHYFLNAKNRDGYPIDPAELRAAIEAR